MLTYLMKRMLELIPTLFGITLISFFIIHLAPGKPTDIFTELNPKITPEAREKLEKYYGLDKPIIVQYGLWLKRIVRLDFGESFSSDHRPVMEKIWNGRKPLIERRLFVTFMINLLSMVVILIIALPLGIFSATHQNTLYDKIATTAVFVGFAMPTFWLALLLMILLGVDLRWLPISQLRSMNYDSLSVMGKAWDLTRHLILPIFVSAFTGLAADSRFMRSSMLEVIRQDFVTVARAKGLPERTVIYRHAFRNALLPIITLMGLSVGSLIGGSVIFENIFGIPGMGQLFYMSVMTRDYPTVMGILTIGAFLTLTGNLLADIGYMLADPRIRAR
ncbi:Oligopeptide transport system permease protein AppB [Candidatus Sulfobium mesophilum]|uniref:Oligopeptide transport system permease protein AppB n=1 Tax=Candidatus Sulfobium mesophilum TaxID=2016548 RepID=A0A2U3QF21_9BACT|nr:Oligopeptide transport system permease protein AppB [Candidatus Sulfobium mesophilum]